MPSCFPSRVYTLPPSLTTRCDLTAVSTTTTARRCSKAELAAAKVHPAPANGAAGKKVMGAADGRGEVTWRLPEWCSLASAAGVLRRHPLPALFACGLLLFMAVEYTIPMVSRWTWASPPRRACTTLSTCRPN